MTEADDTLVQEQFLRELCPVASKNIPPDEFGALVQHLVQLTRRANKFEAQAMRLHERDARLAHEGIDIRRTLMRVAACIPEDDGPASLPKELASGLRSIFEEKTIAQAVAHLSGRQGGVQVSSTDGAIYKNPVRCEFANDKAIQLTDLVTGETFWIPKSQLLDTSEVLDVLDEGTLVVTVFIARSRHWEGWQRAKDL